jgi:UDP-perosamine 4-acetyltransferase
MKKQIVLIGSGGHAKVVMENIEVVGEFEIVGVVTEDSDTDSFYGYKILGNKAVLPDILKDGVKHAALGVGGLKDTALKMNIYQSLISQGFLFVSSIHPSATISNNAIIEAGVHVMAGVCIQAGVLIGENVAIYPNSFIGHDSQVSSHALIAANSSLGGNVVLQEGVLVGLGVSIVPNVTIAKNVTIGAGSVVTRDILKSGIYFGSPAKRVSDHS